MQFDDKEKDEYNEDFSLEEDSNSVSWEDLLNADNDLGLDDLIKNDETSKMLDMPEETKGDKENEETAQEEKFNLDAAANSYVNSLEAEDASVEEALVIDSVDENKVVTDEELLGISISDETIPVNKDLSGIVDEELLNLLDDKSDLQEIPDIAQEDENEEAKQAPVEEETSAVPEVQPVMTPVKEEVEFSQDEPKESPAGNFNKNFKTLVVLLAAGVLVAVIALILVFVMPKNDDNNFEDMAKTNGYDYSASDEELMNEANNLKKGLEDLKSLQKDLEELKAYGDAGDLTEAMNKADKLANKVEKSTKKQKDEKTVIPVSFSGRTNPFLPSSMFDENGFASFGGDLSMPPDVSIDTPEAFMARKLMTISVSGIMFDSNKPSAILKYDNMDYFVQKGDRIDVYTVMAITKDYVAIKNGANVYKAYVGEAFAVDDTPPATQMFMEGGSRHYVSTHDIQISTK